MSELTASRLPLLTPMRPYVSFALSDEHYYQRLLKALRPLESMGLLRSTESRLSILPGEEISLEAKRRIAQAHLLLLMLSISFFACPHCRDHELVSAKQRAVQSQLAHLMPIHLLPVAEEVLAHYGFSQEALLPSDGKPVVSRRTQDQAWSDIVGRLFRIIYAPDRNFDGQLCEVVYQAIIQIKRETQTLDSAELTRLRSLDRSAWEIFMEVFLPVIRLAWADGKKIELMEPSEQRMDAEETAFCCLVYKRLFLSPERLINQYSSEHFRNLTHFIYYISAKILSEQNPA